MQVGPVGEATIAFIEISRVAHGCFADLMHILNIGSDRIVYSVQYRISVLYKKTLCNTTFILSVGQIVELQYK